MTRKSLLRTLAAAAACLILGAAAPSFGPPWISIETPPNPFDRESKGALLVVHTFHHGTPIASGVTGTAEGIVSGARRSVALSFQSTSRPGSYVLRKQWPADGVWMLVINTGGHTGGATALVDLSASGEVSRVQVPARQNGDWLIPQPVSARDIDAALAVRATSASLSTR